MNIYQVREATKAFIQQNKVSNDFAINQPFIPFHFKLLYKSKKGSKDFYHALNNKFRDYCVVTKWSNELYVNFTSEDWKRIHAISYYSISENYYKWFQFRLVHRILGIHKRLYLVKLSDSALCGILKLRVL